MKKQNKPRTKELKFTKDKKEFQRIYDLFKQEDFPTITIGKRKTVTLAAYLLWKMSKKGDV